MIPPLTLAQFCAASYDPSAGWSHFWVNAGIFVFHKRVDTRDVIVFRGSDNREDWLDDFKGWPKLHPELGYCHAGFLEDMEVVFKELLPVLGNDIAITGHSLGAARALIYGALRTCRGLPVAQIVVFGCPRPGFAKLSGILNGGGYPITIYRNRQDPVSEVPTLLPWWQKPVADTPLNAAPPTNDLSPLRDHKMARYVDGIKAWPAK